MIFKTRNIKKQFDTVYDFELKNLIISGSSFAYNNHESAAVAWPYYLRDLGGFEQVLDTSMPGSGNQHIFNSLQWAIENDQPDPRKSLIIVQWSVNTHDDYICPEATANKTYPASFNYSKSVVSGTTGGINGKGNAPTELKNLALTKNSESRAIENYLYISGLFNFLTSQQYKFIFLSSPATVFLQRVNEFKIEKFLPKHINNNLNRMYSSMTSVAEWAVKHDLLSDDEIHPSPDGHLEWTKKVLLPYLIKKLD